MAPLFQTEETMLQFTYKLKLTERVKAKCSRHPRYNHVKDGRAGIRGGCSTCFSLYDLHQARIALDAAQREFVRRAGRGRGNANPERGKPPTQPRNLPCTLSTEIEGLRVQPLFAFWGRGMSEVIQSRMDTRPCGRGGAVPSPAPLPLGNYLTETRRRQ
jgi:hypothetical protein